MPLSEPITSAGGTTGRYAIMEGFTDFNVGGTGLLGANMLYDPFNLATVATDPNPPNRQSMQFNNAGRYQCSFRAQTSTWSQAAVVAIPPNFEQVRAGCVVQLRSSPDLSFLNFIPNTLNEISNIYYLLNAGTDGVNTWGSYEIIGSLGDTIVDIVAGNVVAFSSVGILPNWFGANMSTRIFQRIDEMVTP